MKKVNILCLLMLANESVEATENINYNYLEVGLSRVISDFRSFHDISRGEFFNVSFDITDNFYGGGFINHKGSTAVNGFSGSYGLSWGFHTDISERTDFYAELAASRVNYLGFDSNEYGLSIGTRTAFNDHFELITKIGHRHTHSMNRGNFEAGLKGVFKFNNKHAVFAEYHALDYNLSLAESKLGYRFSF